MSNTTAHPNVPKLARTLLGNTTDRGYERIVAVDSSTFTIGQFVTLLDGTAVAPTPVEYGVKAFADDDLIGYIVTNFYYPVGNGMRSILDDNGADAAGTFTNETAFSPAKYQFAATNDDSNGDSAVRELVELMPICTGDVLEVVLTNDGGTATVDRATTDDFGDTGSSANIGVGLAINTTAPFGLTESTASTTLDNLDFITTRVEDRYPERSDAVYVRLLRSGFNATAAA